jgi:hypothetical protein
MTRRAGLLVCAASLLAGAAGLLAGCATTEWIYEKPGVLPAKLEHDLAACRKDARDPGAIALPGGERVNRELLNYCMERKGYTARKVTPPS